MPCSSLSVGRSATAACVVVLALVTASWCRADSKAESAQTVLKDKLVAVAVFAQSDKMKSYEKTAHSRLECIFRDNGAIVIDEAKAAELRNVWKKLDDPSYIITAEDFVENAGKWEIKVLVRGFLLGDVFRGLADYYTGTAHLDIRFVDSEAGVLSGASIPMGAPGCPPSDGLTESSALVNAVQRAVDDVCDKMRLVVLAPVTPYDIPIQLSGPVEFSKSPLLSVSKVDRSLTKHARLNNPNRWTTESVTVTALAPGGAMAAICGYVQDTYSSPAQAPGGQTAMDRIRTGGSTIGMGGGVGGIKHYSSVVHLIDMAREAEVNVLQCEEPGRGGDAPRKIVACAFASSWRHLAAVSGRNVFLWDTQRGRLLEKREISLRRVPDSVAFIADGPDTYLVIGGGDQRVAFKIVAVPDANRSHSSSL